MTPKRMIGLACILLLACAAVAQGQTTLNKSTLKLEAGDVEQLRIKQGDAAAVRWTSADPLIAAVYGKGYVCGIHPGTTNISAGDAVCAVTIIEPREPIVTSCIVQAIRRQPQVHGQGPQVLRQRIERPTRLRARRKRKTPKATASSIRIQSPTTTSNGNSKTEPKPTTARAC